MTAREEVIRGAERREDGVLSVRPAGRRRICFAIGNGPWTYTTLSAVQAALIRIEESDTGTVQLSGYWVDESDLEVMAR